MEKIPRAMIERAARLYPSIAAASKALGISPSTFRSRCRAYGIEPRRGKSIKGEASRRAAPTGPLS